VISRGWDLPASATGDVSIATVQTACRVSASAVCDRRHKLPFEYLINFWTPREVPLLCPMGDSTAKK
jgi:hypothetical protein